MQPKVDKSSQSNTDKLFKALASNQVKSYRTIKDGKDEDTIEGLIDLGANPNIPDYLGNYPLINAIELINLEAVKMLREKGNANLNIIHANKGTALHIAVQKNNYEIFEYLLNSKVNIDVPDNRGQTPLFLAIGLSNRLFYQALISNGANLYAKDKNGLSPIHIIASKGKHRIFDEYPDKFKAFNNPDNDGLTPIFYAVLNNQEDALKYLVSKAVSINQKDYRSKPLMQYAIEFSGPEIISYMVLQGANLEDVTDKGQDLLEYARNVKNTYETIVIAKKALERKLLESAEAKPQNVLIDENELEFLENEVIFPIAKTGELKNFNGTTILHLAASIGMLESLKKIINKYNFSASIVDSENYNIMHSSLLGPQYAIKHNFTYYLEKYIKSGKVISPAISYSSFVYILEKFPDLIFNPNIYGEVPLFTAVSVGNVNAVRQIMKAHNTMIELKGKDDATVAHYAVSFLRYDILEFLDQIKYNFNSKDKYGYKPIHIADIILHNQDAQSYEKDIAKKMINFFIARNVSILNTESPQLPNYGLYTNLERITINEMPDNSGMRSDLRPNDEKESQILTVSASQASGDINSSQLNNSLVSPELIDNQPAPGSDEFNQPSEKLDLAGNSSEVVIADST